MRYKYFNLFPQFLALFAILCQTQSSFAQQNIILEEDSLGYSTVGCPTPSFGSINISGTADNFNSATDSIGLFMLWGDGTSSVDSVSLIEAGTTDYFYGYLEHTYTMAGTYHQQLFAIAANGISDTIDLDSVVIHNNCVIISGYVYDDANSNCTLESTEDSLMGISIQFRHNGSILGYAVTDMNGYYETSINSNLTGVRAAVVSNNNMLSTTCPVIGYHTFNSTANQSLNFATECTGATDFAAYHSYSGVEPPGSTGVLSFYAGAKTCTSQAGVATLTLDPSIHYAGMISGPAPTTIVGNVLTWNFTALAGMGYYNSGVRPRMNILTDTAASIGDTVCFNVTVTADTVAPNNNSDTWYLIVDGPYDPNNKEVSSTTMEANGNTEPNSTLNFLVNFQNTGTAEAINVYILDSISEYLNLQTLEIIASSHPMNLHYAKDRVLRFDFPKIYLPDSNSNEPASHGFVIYSIEMNDSVALGTVIENTAHIFFDYNAPIVTNTTVNTVYLAPVLPDPLSIALVKSDVTCINWDNGLLDVSVTSGNPPYSYAWSNGESSESLSELAPGTYTVTVTDNEALEAIASETLIENRIHKDPVIGEITTTEDAQSWKTYTYSVPSQTGSSYEWSIVGGEIITTTSNQAEVLWHAGPEGSLEVMQSDINRCKASKSLDVEIAFLGIESTNDQRTAIYPNPTSASVVVEFPNVLNATVEVIDVYGRLVYRTQVNEAKTAQVDLSTLAIGVYTIRINAENIKESHRILKQ